MILNTMVKSQEQITAIFGALADPIRRRILTRLSSSGEGPVTALAKPFGVSLPAISRHLRVLEEARLIERRREGRSHVIRFRPAGMNQARQWMAQFAAGVEFSFDRLDELLQMEQRKESKHGRRHKKRR
jgi:DNA-binding transcriptional ArsR family regulator